MNPSFEFDEVDHFTAGTLGPKGDRAFYLQTRSEGALVTLKVEKQQVLALAEYLDTVLDELPEADEDAPPEVMDLLEPVQPVWVVAQIAVAYDGDDDCVVLMLEELVVDDTADEFSDERNEAMHPGRVTEPATLRVRLSRGQTRALVERARNLVAAGRPPCPYCGAPLNDADNWCPCWN